MSDPESGRCAKCKCNTVLERVECDSCHGRGWNWGGEFGWDPIPCSSCGGDGEFLNTPCCGVNLIDEGMACDEAYDRGRDEGWGQ